MKPLLFMAISLILPSSYLCAQSGNGFTSRQGDYFKGPTVTDGAPIGADKDAIYYRSVPLKRTNLEKGIEIHKYDHNLKLRLKNTAQLPKARQASELVDIMMRDNKIIVLYSFYNYAEKKEFLLMQEIDKNTLEFTGNSTMLLQADLENLGSYYRSVYESSFSPDSSKQIIWYKIYGGHQGSKMITGYAVFDIEFNKVSALDNIDQFKGHLYSITDMVVDNSANVYISYREYPKISGDYETDMVIKCSLGRGKIKQSRGIFENRVIHFDKAGKRSEYHLEIPDKTAYWFFMVPLQKGGVLCTGLYSIKNEASPRGRFAYVLNSLSPSSIKITNTQPFTADFIKQGLSPDDAEAMEDRMKNDKEFDIYDYSLREVFRLKAGELIISVERHCMYTFTRTSGSTVTEIPVYRYSTILLFYFTEEGDFQRILKIPKSQDSNFRNAVGYTFTLIDGQLSFLYNENTHQSNKKMTFAYTTIDKSFKVSTVHVLGSDLFKRGNPQFYNSVWYGNKTCVVIIFSNYSVPHPAMLFLPRR